MDRHLPRRRRSASAPFVAAPAPETARERILRALELGRLGQVLRRMGDDARSGRIARPR
jgi:hypothetical protein